jgi:hypothetical protein
MRAGFAIVARHGGSISADHGIGAMKRDLLPGVKDPVELALMRSLKQMLPRASSIRARCCRGGAHPATIAPQAILICGRAARAHRS